MCMALQAVNELDVLFGESINLKKYVRLDMRIGGGHADNHQTETSARRGGQCG